MTTDSAPRIKITYATLSADNEEADPQRRGQEPQSEPRGDGGGPGPDHPRDSSRPVGQANAAAATMPLYPAWGTITRVKISPSGAG